MCLDDRAYHRQAQPGARHLQRSRRAASVEPLEDLLDLAGVYPTPLSATRTETDDPRGTTETRMCFSLGV